jgi:hypothetical protein
MLRAASQAYCWGVEVGESLVFISGTVFMSDTDMNRIRRRVQECCGVAQVAVCWLGNVLLECLHMLCIHYMPFKGCMHYQLQAVDLHVCSVI